MTVQREQNGCLQALWAVILTIFGIDWGAGLLVEPEKPELDPTSSEEDSGWDDYGEWVNDQSIERLNDS